MKLLAHRTYLTVCFSCWLVITSVDSVGNLYQQHRQNIIQGGYRWNIKSSFTQFKPFSFFFVLNSEYYLFSTSIPVVLLRRLRESNRNLYFLLIRAGRQCHSRHFFVAQYIILKYTNKMLVQHLKALQKALLYF